MTEAPLSKLPESWQWTPLNNIAEISSGFGFPKNYQGKSEGQIPFFKVMDISKTVLSGSIHLRKADNYISFDECQEIKARTLKEGTIVFAKIGEAIKLNRRAILAQESLVDNNVMGLKVISDKIIELFLFYFFNTIKLADYSRATTVPSLRKSDIENIPVPIPPHPEQHRIVARIDELFSHLDAGVKALQRAKAQLQRYRQAVLKAAVEGRFTEEWRKTHPEVESAEKMLERISKERQRLPEMIESTELPNLPRSWIWASTDQLASSEKYSMAIGPFGSNLKVVDYRPEGVPLIFVKNIRLGVFNSHGTWFVSNEKAEELRAHFVESGDILITKMGDPPGDACIYPEGMPPAIITADCIKWRLSPLLKERSYFSNAINSLVVKKQIILSTKGVAQQKISLIRFKKIGIPLPPPQEQNEIAKCIESCFSFANQIESEFDRTILLSLSLRQSILKQAFEGKLVPQDPSDEPASVLLERIKAESAKHARYDNRHHKYQKMRILNKNDIQADKGMDKK